MDRSALERELEALHSQSFAWALVCSGHHRADAEDALQGAYLQVLDGRARFGGRSSFRTWLFGVIRRCAAKQRRRRWWMGTRRNGGRPPPEAVDPAAGADRTLEQEELAARLMSALGTLPTRQQEMLELVFYHEMTIAEAGEVMAVSVGTARTHYERGKKALSRAGPGGAMNPEEHDVGALRDAFQTMRRERERGAGYFADSVEAGCARAGARRASRRRRTLAAAALGIPVAAFLTVQLRAAVRQRADLALAQEATRIAQWHSPTEALLTPSYPNLMREIPSLHASVVEPRINPAGGSL
jgi:RNA polymerase sigma factor (sigma-70 family)